MFHLFLVLVINIVSVSASKCPMKHGSCACNVTSYRVFELKCENLNSLKIEEALRKISYSSDYRMIDFILDSYTEHKSLNMPSKYCSQILDLSLLNMDHSHYNIFGCENNLKNLKTLKVSNNSGMKMIRNDYFRNLSNINSIELKNTTTESVDKKAFEDQTNSLRILKIVGHKVKEIPVEAIGVLHNLQELTFSVGSSLDINKSSIKSLRIALPNLTNLVLPGLLCSCETWTSELRSWTQEKNFQEVKCENYPEKPLFELKKSDLCHFSDNGSLQTTLKDTIFIATIFIKLYFDFICFH